MPVTYSRWSGETLSAESPADPRDVAGELAELVLVGPRHEHRASDAEAVAAGEVAVLRRPEVVEPEAGRRLGVLDRGVDELLPVVGGALGVDGDLDRAARVVADRVVGTGLGHRELEVADPHRHVGHLPEAFAAEPEQRPQSLHLVAR